MVVILAVVLVVVAVVVVVVVGWVWVGVGVCVEGGVRKSDAKRDEEKEKRATFTSGAMYSTVPTVDMRLGEATEPETSGVSL
jgi:flagellar basal body-associated protein FliL